MRDWCRLKSGCKKTSRPNPSWQSTSRHKHDLGLSSTLLAGRSDHYNTSNSKAPHVWRELEAINSLSNVPRVLSTQRLYGEGATGSICRPWREETEATAKEASHFPPQNRQPINLRGRDPTAPPPPRLSKMNTISSQQQWKYLVGVTRATTVVWMTNYNTKRKGDRSFVVLPPSLLIPMK
jgi:hypothetical protein